VAGRGPQGALICGLNELAASFLHMHANRLLRSAPRAQELALYDLLARLYRSRRARRSGKNAGKTGLNS